MPPHVHIVVNNGYRGLIRQSQHGIDTDSYGQQWFGRLDSVQFGGCGVDCVKGDAGIESQSDLGHRPHADCARSQGGREVAEDFSMPIVVEIILEWATDITMLG